MCNLLTRSRFETKSCGQAGSCKFNCALFQEVGKMAIMSDTEKLQFAHAQILHNSNLGKLTKFQSFMRRLQVVLEILKNFRPGERQGFMYFSHEVKNGKSTLLRNERFYGADVIKSATSQKTCEGYGSNKQRLIASFNVI